METVQSPATFAELRRHPRARLQLPVRIRWQRPLGMRLEVTQTIDVCREGILFRRNEACEVATRVWVAFPFEPKIRASAQPEKAARVVRVEREQSGDYLVALNFETVQRGSDVPARRERRKSPRIPFALPIFVRPVGTRWPEESMTQDISQGGARFTTSHGYVVGDTVLATIPWGEWSKAGEISGHVVRVETPGLEAQATPAATSIAVQWIR